MNGLEPVNRPSRAATGAAFAAISLVWGSTFLAIWVAIDTIPPLLMAGSRYLVAGALLYLAVRGRGAGRPTRADWRVAGVIGTLLLLHNGAATWAEQRVPSGLTALLIAAVPLWVTMLMLARQPGHRPGPGTLAGVGLGLAGVVLLVAPWEAGGLPVDLLGAAVILAGSWSWAVGSVMSRGAALPKPALLAVAMEMLVGGLVLTAGGLALGEGARLDLAAISAASAAAWLYLVVFGSLVAFSAYVWLLGVWPASRVATYAYVNPVVALALGAALAGEPLGPRAVLASVVILGGVALAQLDGQRAARRAALRLHARLRPRRRPVRVPPFE